MDNDLNKTSKAEVLAAQKIKETVLDIYTNENTASAIEICRANFDITPNFFIKDNGAKNLDDFIQQAVGQWSNGFTNGRVPELERYIFDNFKMEYCEPKKINRRIFVRIATAILFGIPQELILKCIPAILKSDYFPTIDNHLKIQINELTSIEDIKHIWPQVMIKQNIFKWDQGDKNIKIFSRVKGKKEYPSRKRNDEVIKIEKEHPEFNHEEILEELGKRGYNNNIGVNNISIILGKEKKRRQK